MGPESGGRWRCRQEEVGGRVRSQGRGGGPGGERFRGTDRGVATVWVAVTTVALCAVFALVLELGQAVTARHRAGGAADLAALAAADRALEGPEAACEAARRVALAQKAVLVRCSVQGEIADVVARSSLGRYAPAVRARAAPPAGPRAVVAGRSSFASATSHRTVSAGPDVRVGRREHDFQVPRAPPGQAPTPPGAGG
ncbi:Rv3654c family TadE-like protein [Streptomyces cyaneofuscatus]|uniref:Rv3654c family TadE-like protein n=1 Tax=Streptomyces cyaneofuscatus TaxID=66883 RepID=UPI003449AA56